jgi:hypothetical protein
LSKAFVLLIHPEAAQRLPGESDADEYPLGFRAGNRQTDGYVFCERDAKPSNAQP